ncbi:MAG: RimK family alpha-L-glutamate ligase [Saprospiraceae bacterium]
MQQFKMLILTDHEYHSAENSLYHLAKAVYHHPRCAQVDVATRVNALNEAFFYKYSGKSLFATPVNEGFTFHADGRVFKKNLRRVSLYNYDVIWLRMPPPLSAEFLTFLEKKFPNVLIINDPMAILATGSKAFLLRFSDICPPMKICRSVEDIVEFKQQFPIVLKPFREYGGRGIILIKGEEVWLGKTQITFAQLVEQLAQQPIEYLAVKFLKNVKKGDKRIVVVAGKIMGASLRLPAADSWICNVAMGGSSNFTEVDDDERNIVARVNEELGQMGIVMYGVDTLVNDDGKRVLSELNTTSIGGLPQIARMMNQPLVKEAVDLICQFIMQKITKYDANTSQ